MSSQQSGATQGTDQPGASTAPTEQMSASQPGKSAKAPGYAAFGTTSGSVVMFRDLASI